MDGTSIRHLQSKKVQEGPILSCGNGWVERDLFEKGIIESAVGIDINDDLLSSARASAVKLDLPFRYYKMDSNEADSFPEDGFDVAINHASLHHVANIDRLVRSIYNALLTSGGILVNYEFVGPHRNQYGALEWATILSTNNLSESTFRHERLAYPHLPTMLLMDPSEAIHSELITSVVHRYFSPIHSRMLNGAIAYPLLTHNKNIGKYRSLNCLNHRDLPPCKYISDIIAIDDEYSKQHPDSSLFWYSIVAPKLRKQVEPHEQRWSKEEEEREERARQSAGIYYSLTPVHRESYGPTLKSA